MSTEANIWTVGHSRPVGWLFSGLHGV